MNIKKIINIVDAMRVDTIGGKRLPKRGATSKHDKFADKCPRKFKSPKDYPVGDEFPEDIYDPEAEKQAKADMKASGLYGHVYDSKKRALKARKKKLIKDSTDTCYYIDILWYSPDTDSISGDMGATFDDMWQESYPRLKDAMDTAREYGPVMFEPDETDTETLISLIVEGVEGATSYKDITSEVCALITPNQYRPEDAKKALQAFKKQYPNVKAWIAN